MRRAVARAAALAAAARGGAGAGASAAAAAAEAASASARLAGQPPARSSARRAFSSSSRAAAESHSVWEAASPARRQLFAELSLARGMLPHRGGLVASFSPHGVSLLPSHLPRASPPPLDDAELGLREADENVVGAEEVGLDLAAGEAAAAAVVAEAEAAAVASPAVFSAADQQGTDGAMYADSVKRKRKLKMKRHKHRKRLKKMRSQT